MLRGKNSKKIKSGDLEISPSSLKGKTAFTVPIILEVIFYLDRFDVTLETVRIRISPVVYVQLSWINWVIQETASKSVQHWLGPDYNRKSLHGDCPLYWCSTLLWTSIQTRTLPFGRSWLLFKLPLAFEKTCWTLLPSSSVLGEECVCSGVLDSRWKLFFTAKITWAGSEVLYKGYSTQPSKSLRPFSVRPWACLQLRFYQS